MKKFLLLAVVGVSVLAAVLVFVKSGGSSVRKPGPPPSKPKEAVVWTANLYRECYEQGKLDTLYYALPKSWRADVEKKIVAEFAKKMDEELWKAASDLLGDLAPVLRAQAANIVELYDEARRHDKSMPKIGEEDVKLAAELLGALPDALDLSRFRKGDLDGLLGKKTVQKFLARLAELLNKKLQVKSVKLDEDEDDEVVVKYKFYHPGEDEWRHREETVRFAKVEGVWVPEELSEKWDDAIEAAADAADEFDGEVDEDVKKAVLRGIEIVRKHLPKIKKAKDADALKDALAELGEDLREELEDMEGVGRRRSRGDDARIASARSDIAVLETAASTFWIKLGRRPASIREMQQSIAGAEPILNPAFDNEDPWGNEYQIRIDWVNNILEIRSAGPDGCYDTSDDISNRGF